jgi:hypothetical protein
MTTQATDWTQLARARATSLADITPLADPPLGNAPITPDRYFSRNGRTASGTRSGRRPGRSPERRRRFPVRAIG